MKLQVSYHKTAFLFIFHGSSNIQTNEYTVNKFVNHFKRTFVFDDYFVYFTSRIVRIRMSQNKEQVNTLQETLEHIKALGYDSVVIVFSNIIYGSVVQSNLDMLKECQVTFEKMVIMKGLLQDDNDIEVVGNIMIDHFTEPTILLGHGQQHESDSYYHKLDSYLLTNSSHRCLTLNSSLIDFKYNDCQKITVFPFLLMLGHHARRDIAQKLKDNLQLEGIEMSMIEKSVVDIDRILDYYVEKTQRKVE